MPKLTGLIVRKDTVAQLVDLGNPEAPESFTFGGERFVTENQEFEWYGFYDWLRVETGEIVGVRITFDDGVEIDPKAMELLRAGALSTYDQRIFMYVDKDKEICEELSDDADFGGNALYVGDKGSFALTFNQPARISGVRAN